MGHMTITIDSKAHYKIMEDLIMPAIVEFPTVVKEALDEFGLEKNIEKGTSENMI